MEELEDIWHDVGGGSSVLEASITEPATPIKEELEAARKRLSLTISCLDKVMSKNVKVEARAPKKDVHPLLCMCPFFMKQSHLG